MAFHQLGGPSLSLRRYGKIDRLHLNADAQRVLATWHGNDGPLRVTLARSTAEPSLVAVALDPYGKLLNSAGYASAASFTKELGVDLPVDVKLTPNQELQLLIGNLAEKNDVPLKLPPPVEQAAPGSFRAIIQQVSTADLPPEEPVYTETDEDGDDDSDEDDGDDE
jgi:hypothetical protein